MRAIVLAAFAAFAVVATTQSAKASVEIRDLQVAAMVQARMNAGLNWKVGDQADYTINMGGFIKGKSHNFVREETATSFWMQQDMDLSIQKAKIEVLMNKSTGQIEKLLMNGQEQSIPKANVEIVEMKEAHITVAAGSFDCIYAKIRDKGDGKISEAWINPQVVPMSGTLKAIGDSQFGKVVQEATSMQFAPR